MKEFKGMFAAMPTPFLPNEEVDFDGAALLIRHLAASGLHGVIIGGSTGEAPLLSLEERRELIRVCCEAAEGKLFLAAGTGCACQRDTLSLCKTAAQAGADLNLVITPYYMTYTKDAIFHCCREVAEASELPVMIYHYPGATGVLLEPEQIFELCQTENIVGVKNTEDMDHTAKVIALARRDKPFLVASGYDSLMLPALAAGADVSMGVVHNLIPKTVLRLYDHTVNGHFAEAREIANRIMPLIVLLEKEPYPGPVKAALSLMGLPGGLPRKPVPPVSAKLVRELETCLQSLDVFYE